MGIRSRTHRRKEGRFRLGPTTAIPMNHTRRNVTAADAADNPRDRARRAPTGTAVAAGGVRAVPGNGPRGKADIKPVSHGELFTLVHQSCQRGSFFCACATNLWNLIKNAKYIYL